MIDKPIDDIAVEDVQHLVVNQVPESRSLEYKQSLPGTTEGDRKEFLADVSSFANATGGDLLYGVTERREENRTTGLPERVGGLAGVNADAEGLKLENMLRDGVAPRIPGVRLRWLPGFAQGPVLIIRVPRSWAGPHMVTFQQHSRFYSRNSGGKYPLDVFELRQAFLGSGSLSERVREFRAERIGRLVAGERPIHLISGQLVCVHLVPHVAFAGAFDIDVRGAATPPQVENIQPLYSSGLTWTFNLDRFLSYAMSAEGGASAYLQLYRNAAVESVNSIMVRQVAGRAWMMPSLTFALELMELVTRLRRLMRGLAVEPPASILVSLLAVKGLRLGIDSQWNFYHSPRPFDRDNILFRDLLLTDWEGGSMTKIVKPLLDEVWQAAGLERCFDYDEHPNWAPRR
jgi:hypothetical protein